MGRCKHECATTTIAQNGQVVVYTGDDERFDYVYKFVTAGVFNRENRAANMDLLDNGVCYVAKFNADGTGVWLPVVHGQGPLTVANGWRNQADVLIRMRQAGDALGATRMDRPEDVEVNPVTGIVYIACTNNTQRGVGAGAGPDAANPRANNRSGHIIEIKEAGNDHTRTTFNWVSSCFAATPMTRLRVLTLQGLLARRFRPLELPTCSPSTIKATSGSEPTACNPQSAGRTLSTPVLLKDQSAEPCCRL
jgi:secreted PhoX family phosphatase